MDDNHPDRHAHAHTDDPTSPAQKFFKLKVFFMDFGLESFQDRPGHL